MKWKKYIEDETGFRKAVLFILVVGFLLNALYSLGYFQYDEHHQILEFANYKLGKTSASDLPWEFGAQMRPALQVFFAYQITLFWNYLGVDNPFHIAISLRLLSGMLSLFVFWCLFFYFKKEIQNDFKIPNFALISLLCITFWFIPFIGVRFSSENWSGIFFAYAIFLLLRYPNRLVMLIAAGICFGIAFQCRFQIGIAIAGYFLWSWIVQNKFRLPKEIWIIGFSMTAVIALVSYLIDSWFYGELVFPAYNYFHVNIIQDRASQFGTEPFWVYFPDIIESFLLPFGIIPFLLICAFFYWYKKHIFTWISLPFLLVHMLIPHKEFRFLLPMVYIVPPMILLSLVHLYSSYLSRVKAILTHPKFIWGLNFYFILNIIILFQRSLYPARTEAVNMKYFYETFGHSSNKVFVISDMVETVGLYWDYIALKNTFHRPANVVEIPLLDKSPQKNEAKITSLLKDWKEQGIDTFFIHFVHSRFHLEEIPFSENFDFLKNKCRFEYNLLEDPKIKYNLYRLVRQEGYLLSLYKCQV